MWDLKTEKKLDKDRFRKDLGNVIQGYQEVARRLGIMPEETNISEVNFGKTTSIKFKNNAKIFVATCYGLCALLILTLCLSMEINIYPLILSLFFILSLVYQIKIFNADKPKTCLHSFRINNLTGIFIFLYILSFQIL